MFQEDNDHQWLPLCDTVTDKLDGGEAKLLARLQLEPSSRSSPKLDVWLSRQLNETTETQSNGTKPIWNFHGLLACSSPMASIYSESAKDIPPSIEIGSRRSASLSTKSASSIGQDAQYTPPSSGLPCKPRSNRSNPVDDKSIEEIMSTCKSSFGIQHSGIMRMAQDENRRYVFGNGPPPQNYFHNQSSNNEDQTSGPTTPTTVSHCLAEDSAALVWNPVSPSETDTCHQAVDDRQWAKLIDCVYIFPCQYQYLEQCQQASGRLSLEKKWFESPVTKSTALFFCNTDDPQDMVSARLLRSVC